MLDDMHMRTVALFFSHSFRLHRRYIIAFCDNCYISVLLLHLRVYCCNILEAFRLLYNIVLQ